MPFEIPENWSFARMNSVLDVRDGTHDSPKYYKEGIPFVTSKNLKNGEIDFSTCKLISIEDSLKFNERSRVDENDVLFSMIGTIGNPTIVHKDREFSIKNVALFKNISRELISETWIKYVLESVTSKMKNDARGGLQPFVSLDFLRNYIMPVPPRNEQLKIISIINNLSKYIYEIDSSFSALNTYIDFAKRKILDSIFGDNSSYKSYYENMTLITDDIELFDNLRKPINSDERSKRTESAEKLYPYYGATGQTGFIDDYIFDGEYVLLGEDGAPFLDKNSCKAYIITGKTWVNNHAHVLKSKTNNKFLMYYLNWFDYFNYVSGTTRLKLNQAMLKKIPFPNMSTDIKNRIVNEIENAYKILDTIN